MGLMDYSFLRSQRIVGEGAAAVLTMRVRVGESWEDKREKKKELRCQETEGWARNEVVSQTGKMLQEYNEDLVSGRCFKTPRLYGVRKCDLEMPLKSEEPIPPLPELSKFQDARITYACRITF